jgi:VWFA-related protein
MGRAILRRSLHCFFTLACLYRADSRAQSVQPSAQATVSSETSMLRVNAQQEGLVHLDIAVQDQEGNFVSGLTEKYFRILDKESQQKIVSFRTSKDGDEEARLTEVVLVLDEVNLSPIQFLASKTETMKFLQQNGGHLAYPVSVYWFTTNGLYASAKPTLDGNALAEEAVRHHPSRVVWEIPQKQYAHLPQTQMRYAMWDSAVRTVYSIAIERRSKPGRKALIWMGIGWPASMQKSVELAVNAPAELSTRIREARMVVFQVTVWPDSLVPNFDYWNYLEGVESVLNMQNPTPHFALPVLALQSGGLVMNSSPDLVRDIEHCVGSAGTFYAVSFDPPHAVHSNEYHDLKVEIATPGFSAHTNTGYYDQPVFYDQPRVRGRRVTVRELEQILAAASGQHDVELAEQLAGLELTERLKSGQLSLWKERLHGKKSKAALAELADGSVFLDPPAAETLSNPEPDADTQRQMQLQVRKYLDDALPKLPDFFATRTMIKYEQRLPKEGDSWTTALADQSLHEAETDKAILHYRNGQEEWDAEGKKGSKSEKAKGLNFNGIFGPILNYVFTDATHSESQIVWSRWERSEQGTEAVFRYSVHGKSPHYGVVDCCLVGGKVFRASPEYHGELMIDPATGSILRLTMELLNLLASPTGFEPVLSP